MELGRGLVDDRLGDPIRVGDGEDVRGEPRDRVDRARVVVEPDVEPIEAAEPVCGECRQVVDAPRPSIARRAARIPSRPIQKAPPSSPMR